MTNKDITNSKWKLVLNTIRIRHTRKLFLDFWPCHLVSLSSIHLSIYISISIIYLLTLSFSSYMILLSPFKSHLITERSVTFYLVKINLLQKWNAYYFTSGKNQQLKFNFVYLWICNQLHDPGQISFTF